LFEEKESEKEITKHSYNPTPKTSKENILTVFLPLVWCAYAMITSETNFCQTSCSVHPSSLLTGIRKG